MKKVNSFAPGTYRKPPAGVKDFLLHLADGLTNAVSHFGNEPGRFRSANAGRATNRAANYLPLWLQANPGRCTLDDNNFCRSNAPLTITPSVNCRPNRELRKLA